MEYFDDEVPAPRSGVGSDRETDGKHVDYVFTLNNYNDEIISGVKSFGERECTYLVYQHERGESGTPHLQGYFRFKSRRSFRAIVRLLQESGLRGIHVEIRRGTIEQAIEYCTRESKRDVGSNPNIVELGRRPPGGGSRSDLRSIIEAVKQGKTARQLFEEHPEAYVKYARGIDKARFVFEKARDFKTVIKWYYGSTGSGKTRLANDEAGNDDVYWKAGGTKWWCGYEGQTNVVIDDYRCDLCPFHVLLRLFDRYPCMVEGKGMAMQFRSRTIWVTAPHRPEVMWRKRCNEDIDQLLRRIETIQLFGEEPTVPEDSPQFVTTFNH